MKIGRKIIIGGLLSATTLPAMACDMHGGGLFWTPMNHWQNFSPMASTVDPAFSNDDDLAVPGERANRMRAITPQPRKVRPSFSNAADRAALAAKARLVQTLTANSRDDSASMKESVVRKDAGSNQLKDLDPDTQTVR